MQEEYQPRIVEASGFSTKYILSPSLISYHPNSGFKSELTINNYSQVVFFNDTIVLINEVLPNEDYNNLIYYNRNTQKKYQFEINKECICYDFGLVESYTEVTDKGLVTYMISNCINVDGIKFIYSQKETSSFKVSEILDSNFATKSLSDNLVLIYYPQVKKITDTISIKKIDENITEIVSSKDIIKVPKTFVKIKHID